MNTDGGIITRSHRPREGAEVDRAHAAHIQALLNAAPIGVFLIDQSFHVCEANPLAQNFFGNPSELIGRDFGELAATLWPLEAREVVCLFRRTLETGEPFVAPERIQQRRGVFEFYEWQVHRIPLSEGKHGVVCYFRDISDRKRIDETLRKNHERLEFLTDASQVGIWFCDLPFDELVWDHRVKEHFWLKPDARVTIDIFYQRIHPEDRERTRASIERAVLENSRYDMEYRTVSEEGAEKWIRAIGHAHYDSQGKPIRFDGVTIDITESRRAEEARRESEERYRSLFDSIDEGFCVIEMIFDDHQRPVDYRFIEVNPAFEKQAGMRNAAGKRMLEFVSHIEPHWLETYGRVAVTGEPIRFADEYKSLGSWFDVYAFRAGDPQLRRVAVIFNNISGRKKAEAELLQSQAELAAANQQLASHAKHLDSIVEKRTEELREVVQQLETFSYSIVHDMRAPLRSMRSFAGILVNDHSAQLNEDGKRFLRRIMDSASRMDALITDVLNYSKVSMSSMEMGTVKLDRLIPEIIEQYPQFQEKSRAITLQRPFPKVRGNAALLTQVFSNLIGNAIKFVPPNQEPQVVIRAEKREDRWRIWVDDNGIGISPNHREKLFGLFQRLHGPNEYTGTGVGLAIVKRAVEKMGGTVGLESELGKGSHFWIELMMDAQ